MLKNDTNLFRNHANLFQNETNSNISLYNNSEYGVVNNSLKEDSEYEVIFYF